MRHLTALLVIALVVPVLAADHQIDIQDFNYDPAAKTISVGDTITWTNIDMVDHSVTHDSGDFDSGLLSHGESWSYTFNEAGEFDYYCTVHPAMTAVVIVESDAPINNTSWGELKRQLR